MINVDLKQFFRQHYWLGLYYWNECLLHKHYKSNCSGCNAGKWKIINPGAEKSPFTIFRMPMNNVLWPKDEEDDD